MEKGIDFLIEALGYIESEKIRVSIYEVLLDLYSFAPMGEGINLKELKKSIDSKILLLLKNSNEFKSRWDLYY